MAAGLRDRLRKATIGGMAVHASITPYLSAGDRCRPLFFAGPCVIESRAHTLKMAKAVKAVFEELGVSDRLVFKASFDKANRSAGDAFRGPGIEKGLDILSAVKEKLDLPILTDVHEVAQCERGTTFGYHNLVVDFRGLPMMRSLGAPVIYDATHSLQLPGGLGKETGGARQYAPALARAAAAVGVDGYFLEVHDDPANAKSDRATQLPLAELPKFLSDLLKFDALRRETEG